MSRGSSKLSDGVKGFDCMTPIQPAIPWKKTAAGNPVSPDIYCADPTAVVYEGRLYLYGTNDHQQLLEGKTGSNTYEAIRSFVVFSTADMVNWTYHGIIPTGEIAPWIIASWAPSVVSRKEADGLTHFYLYFSNSGCGVGVLTSTDPVRGWSDPLGHPLIEVGMPGLGDVPNPFDPGAAIDSEGNGWLTFGGGIAKHGTAAMPHTARIVRLGADLISPGSEISEIPAPYFFEASELNIIGDTFVYTYNTNWEPRDAWDYSGKTAPTRCSMCCMTSKTPLIPESWVYQKDYFANPGDSGYPDSNNHTHLQEFDGQWYLFYHTLQREAGTGGSGGYRSLCVTPMQVHPAFAEYEKAAAADAGAPQKAPLNPFIRHSAAELSNSAGISYVSDSSGAVTGVRAEQNGAWICVRGADFGSGGNYLFSADFGSNRAVSVRPDAPDGTELCSANSSAAEISGVHDLYLLLPEKDTVLLSWQFS